ncbi:uncharacterized protein PV09_02257 [Verruconis gallopava]|uniref:Uncharacterized protein n=1 Tax=Verruconis gallopava TaxID=253628 RepID=A0A0D2ALP1_9PEZI|nr:uncharacterized protein PV09_02257 [Verruconis gallopava]KIW07415.1 hypothetical protein PV09_02257 [Verruconis gallopava]
MIMDLLNCFGGQVFCTSGVASLMGLRFSLSSIGPTPTDGGGMGVCVAARNEGVLIRRLEDSVPSGSLCMTGVSGRAHLGGGTAGVCETGAADRAVIGVFRALLFGLGVCPGTCVRSTR